MGGSYAGYEQYQKDLLSVPLIAEYGDASSDDLSSEWDSDVPDVPPSPPRTSHKVGIKAASHTYYYEAILQ